MEKFFLLVKLKLPLSQLQAVPYRFILWYTLLIIVKFCLFADLNHLYPPGPGRSGGGGGHTAPVQADSLDMFPFQVGACSSPIFFFVVHIY